MKLKLFSILGILLCTLACEKIPIVEYQIIPQPQTVEYTEGVYTLGDIVKISYPDELTSEAELLKGYLSEIGLKSELGGADIKLILDPAFNTEKENGYNLKVSKGIEIKSNTSTGIFYGLQSLRQIIRAENGKFVVQHGNITDYPNLSWRAFMLDEGRYFKGKDVVKRLLDEMSLLKMNTFHWHLTNDQGWRLEIKKYPKLTEIGSQRETSEINHFGSDVFDGKAHGGFYTQEDAKEIVAYAVKLHINIVPEIGMPGHACAAIASYPWLGTDGREIKVPGKFGVHYDVFNVADPKVEQFFEDVFDEVITLFPYKVIHIGGDEVKYDHWKNSAMVKAYMQKHNLKTPAELQVFFTNKISNMLVSKGKRMMGWNEITGEKLHEYQSSEDTNEVSQALSKETLVHFWKGELDIIQRTAAKGLDIVNSFHKFTYLDYSYESIPLSKAYGFNPIPEGLPTELDSKILGGGCQMWCEFISNEDDMNKKVYPRIAAYAEGGWIKSENKDYDRFKTSLVNFTSRWDKKGISYGDID